MESVLWQSQHRRESVGSWEVPVGLTNCRDFQDSHTIHPDEQSSDEAIICISCHWPLHVICDMLGCRLVTRCQWDGYFLKGTILLL